MPSSRKRRSFRLGWWGTISVRQNKCSFVKTVGGFFRRKRRKKQLSACILPERLFCLIRKGQYLACLVKCVGAKCTKRCCRVQRRSAQRCGFVFEVFCAEFAPRFSILNPHLLLLPLCALSNSALCTLHIGPRLVNILSDIEMKNWKCKMQNEGSATHCKASHGTTISSGFLFSMYCFLI